MAVAQLATSFHPRRVQSYSPIALGVWVATALLALAVESISSSGSPLGVVSITALATVILVFWMFLDRDKQLDLGTIFLVALAARFATATFVHHIIYRYEPALFAPDELHYDTAGWWYTQYLKGLAPHPYANDPMAAPIFLSGVLYYLFGHCVLIPKLAIAILGASTAPLTALLVSQIDRDIAKRSAYLTALFPSLVLWSSLLIKDIIALFGVQLALYAFLEMRTRLRWWQPVAFSAGMALAASSRPYEMAFVIVAIFFSFLAETRRRTFGRQLVLFVVMSVLATVLLQKFWLQPVEIAENTSLLEQASVIRAGYAANTGSAVNLDIVDTRSVGGMLAWIPIGLLYFFFAPFPFTGTSLISLATSPEMIALYFLIPAMFRGAKLFFRLKRNLFMVLFVYTMMSAIGWSMLITNVGTMYRYRAQVLFFLLVLVAFDWSHVAFRRRQNPLSTT